MATLPTPPPPSITSIIYVVGEVLMSLAALGLGGYLLAVPGMSPQANVVGGTLVSAIVVFWFQRRQAEQSNNTLATIADGKLSQLMEAQRAINSQQSNLLMVMTSSARSSAASANAAETSSQAAQAAIATVAPSVLSTPAPAAPPVAVEPDWMASARAAGWDSPDA